MRIAFFGPPGAGKGTQALMLADKTKHKHISTGAIIREAMKAKTPIGEAARKYMDEGVLVPDHLVQELAKEAITDSELDCFILDGFPRTLPQARWLNAFLKEHGTPLHAIISLVVPDEIIIDRLSKRRVHAETGENYHLDFRPPPKDIDPALIMQRPDDKPEAIRQRLSVYHQQTEPIESYFRDLNLLVEVDGVGTFDEVQHRIEVALEKARERYYAALER